MKDIIIICIILIVVFQLLSYSFDTKKRESLNNFFIRRNNNLGGITKANNEIIWYNSKLKQLLVVVKQRVECEIDILDEFNVSVFKARLPKSNRQHNIILGDVLHKGQYIVELTIKDKIIRQQITID